MADQKTLICDSGGGGCGGGGAEIDTSAPFESVKEAVSKFGGGGFWKPLPSLKHKPSLSPQPCDVKEDTDIAKVEAEAAELEKELILKERDTFEVLKELEATKMMVEELKSKLSKEESAIQLKNSNTNSSDEKPSLAKEEEEEEEKENNPNLSVQKLPENSNCLSSSTTGLILMELKQAKMNLTRTTDDLSEIRALVESYNKKIERERVSLEKTRERLRSNSLKVSALEEEINQTRSKLQETKDTDDDVMAELHRLTSEAEKFKKMGEAAKSEVMKVISEIEHTTAKVKTAEIRLIAAQKMREAARAAEAVALSEIKALEASENEGNPNEKVTLTLEEYASLRSKGQDAEVLSKEKILEAMLQVEEVEVSRGEIMKRVEEAMEEVKTSKEALEEALRRVEAANKAKLTVEEALRKWRSEHGERRRSLQSSIKFKNPYYPSHRRRDSARVIDLNGMSLVNDDDAPAPPVLKSTLSIGQILSRKLLITEEYGESGKRSGGKRKVSLGQMLGKQNGDMSSAWKVEERECGGGGGGPKKLPAKRKKFGFASRFSVLLTKQSRKKKKNAITSTTR